MNSRSFWRISVSVLALSAVRQAHADQGGTAFWTSGQVASFAAIPPDPGFSIPVVGYYYDGSASASKSFQTGDIISTGLRSQLALLNIAPTFAPDLKFLGGQPAFSLSIGWGQARAEAQFSSTAQGTTVNRSDKVWGVTDLIPMASLAWSFGGMHNAMVYLTGGAPVGTYDANRLANIGIGHGAVDAGGGYTLLNTNIGIEFSVVGGFTYNLESDSTDYKNGIDSHLDYAVSLFLNQNFHIGPVGYLYYQVTGDSGSGDKVGSFESKVAAIGGEVGYFFDVGGRQWYLNFRGYTEFWAAYRTEGYDLWLTLNIPLGGAGK